MNTEITSIVKGMVLSNELKINRLKSFCINFFWRKKIAGDNVETAFERIVIFSNTWDQLLTLNGNAQEVYNLVKPLLVCSFESAHFFLGIQPRRNWKPLYAKIKVEVVQDGFRGLQPWVQERGHLSSGARRGGGGGEEGQCEETVVRGQTRQPVEPVYCGGMSQLQRVIHQKPTVQVPIAVELYRSYQGLFVNIKTIETHWAIIS